MTEVQRLFYKECEAVVPLKKKFILKPVSTVLSKCEVYYVNKRLIKNNDDQHSRYLKKNHLPQSH